MAKRRENLLFGLGMWHKKNKKEEQGELVVRGGVDGSGKIRKDWFLKKKRAKRKKEKKETERGLSEEDFGLFVKEESEHLSLKGKEREEKREREEESQKKGRKRRKKNLGDFCSLPYDVLIHIVLFLAVEDVYSLGQTDRQMRSFVTSFNLQRSSLSHTHWYSQFCGRYKKLWGEGRCATPPLPFSSWNEAGGWYVGGWSAPLQDLSLRLQISPQKIPFRCIEKKIVSPHSSQLLSPISAELQIANLSTTTPFNLPFPSSFCESFVLGICRAREGVTPDALHQDILSIFSTIQHRSARDRPRHPEDIIHYIPQTYPELELYGSHKDSIIRPREVIKGSFSSVLPTYGLSRSLVDILRQERRVFIYAFCVSRHIGHRSLNPSSPSPPSPSQSSSPCQWDGRADEIFVPFVSLPVLVSIE